MGVISINLFIFFFRFICREELYDERLSRTVLDGTDIHCYARLPKIYFTAATMMDEKLTILTLFCIFNFANNNLYEVNVSNSYW